ncbi:MAG: cyclic nucleotide-binding domain-containing protein [Nitrososphaerales archaeon]
MVGLEALRKSDIFEGLSDDELAAIAKMAREEIYDTGCTIFRENEIAKNLYIVREGRVAVLIDIGRGKQTVIDTIGRNGSFGWSAMVPPYILTGTAKTMERTRVIVLTGQDLRELCRVNCGTCYTIMEKLATIISGRLKDTRLQLISLMYG